MRAYIVVPGMVVSFHCRDRRDDIFFSRARSGRDNRSSGVFARNACLRGPTRSTNGQFSGTSLARFSVFDDALSLINRRVSKAVELGC